MSALPFISALPPSQTSSPANVSGKPETASNAAPALASRATLSESSQSETMGEPPLDQENGSQSFWDTLQQQAASSDPSTGQGFAAIKGAHEDFGLAQENENAFSVEEIYIEEIVMDAVPLQDSSIEDDTSQPLFSMASPWSMGVKQDLNKQDLNLLENPSLDQILSQRLAQPKMHSFAELSVNGPLSKHELNGPMVAPQMLTAAVTSPGASAEGAVLQATGLNSGVAMNVNSSPSLNVMNTMTNEPSAQEGQLAGGLKLDESLLSEKPINLHEKPITLGPQQNMVPQDKIMSPAIEAMAADATDSVDGLSSSLQQANKEMQQASKSMQNAPQNIEKSFSSQAKIDVPPTSPQFTGQVAQRLAIMSSEQIQTARIQLDPPELGSLQVKIKVQHDQVSVAFASGHQVVRDALESQTPRLREMLEQQGVELKDVNVSDQQEQHQQAGTGESSDDSGFASGDDWDEEVMAEQGVVTEMKSDSLVDFFA